ncbi:hypothetical protein [Rhizobium sp. H4]|uniref:hypothetical protein n=1 Tax=Rhizobium sp. H4 TaxID=2035449 RepID=UPI000D10E40F|nr:hypothetical protein [Rhizobium sp. H4]
MKRRDFSTVGLTALLGGMVFPAFPSTGFSEQRKPSIPALPNQRKLWSWIKRLNSFGPRLTGSPAQARAIDYLAGELRGMGLEVKRDQLTMRRWMPRTTAFKLSNGDVIEVAAPFPYSGLTPPGGISGKMVLFNGRVQVFEKARGKIAVVTVKRRDLAAFLELVTNRRGSLPEGIDFPKAVTTPLITGLLGVPIDKAREAGVLAVVCIFEGVSEVQLKGQVLPFTTPYWGLPAIWVAQSEGERIKAAIKHGLSGRLTLDGTLEDVATDTIYAVLPGCNLLETIIINTHTDGPNACEENGGAGVLALAHYFSSLPKSARNRSLVFVLVTGHFQLPQFGRHGNQATATWLEMHPELWDGKPGHAKAVAGATIEHLGCTEWRDDFAKGHPAPTGKPELDLIYTSNKSMSDVYIAAARGRKKVRALIVAPAAAQVMLGEGQPLYASGIPTISSCPIPDYLCQVLPGGGLDRLDPDYAFQQVETFARTVDLLDRMPRGEIGIVPFNLSTVIGDLL